jgi:hypothetical protein
MQSFETFLGYKDLLQQINPKNMKKLSEAINIVNLDYLGIVTRII